ncbi:hypothetical protein PGT21_022798 [Puccinia graminis f. sp. tritici]|uniref:Uncharacterized protein n=1 Tax=Puccinia graminis f. sp. tritici TaxID=56615 RepID=A0A5B0P149_PUCGR|nr:hypothetical protein PGT21_022798 [Puccinia graminis f. sp. tritici]
MDFIPSGPVYDHPPTKIDKSIGNSKSFLSSSEKQLSLVGKSPPPKTNPLAVPPNSLPVGSPKNSKAIPDNLN